jgi:hypothetical protein
MGANMIAREAIRAGMRMQGTFCGVATYLVL